MGWFVLRAGPAAAPLQLSFRPAGGAIIGRQKDNLCGGTGVSQFPTAMPFTSLGQIDRLSVSEIDRGSGGSGRRKSGSATKVEIG